MMRSVLLVILAIAAVAAVCPAIAFAGEKHAKPIAPATVARDCTPINGRYGYYGNPWCDTGSYRQEDVEFRARQVRARKLKAE